MKSQVLEKRYGRLTLVLDSNEFFPSDPGNGTPDMVYIFENKEILASSTYNCAINVGYLDGDFRCYNLTENEMNWLCDQIDFIDQTFQNWERLL